MSYQLPASSYPTSIFSQISPDESQETADQPRFQTWYKGHMTGSEIYERMFPDGETSALRIEGPSKDIAAIVLDSKGCVKLLTGERSKETGPGSGRLCVKTWGQQQLHNQRSNFEYNAGDDEEGQALNLIAYGDYVEQTVGGTRYVRAQKIVIEASEELLLIGKTQVNIQAGSAGGGAIIMNAGSIERTTSNDKETILGQKMSFGVSEDTTLTFDPRGSKNLVSTGHYNHKILGDYQTWTGGIESHVIAGGPGTPPLIKDRTNAFLASTTGNVTIATTLVANITSVTGLNLIATTGNTIIKGALILLN